MQPRLHAEVPVFSDRFERWRFLRDLLDGDGDETVINFLLYKVLESHKKNTISKSPEEDASGSPELTHELIAKIEGALELADQHALLILGEGTDEELLRKLEDLLPDPVKEEDANRSVWDTLMEIHGRELVKANETNATLEWRKLCLAARLLIHFDFLTMDLA